MIWEQKVTAMQCIGEVSLKMRAPGNWYVSITGVERVEEHVLSGGFVAAGSPEAAVNEKWVWLTCDKYHLSISPRGHRSLVRWNGFMWEHVEPEVQARP